MKIWACRSYLPLAEMLATLSIAGCEAASAVAVTTGPTAVTVTKCQPVLGASSNVGAAGGPSAVSITTQPECGWTASTQASWITDLSPSSGQGSGQLAFRAAPDTEPSAREADIIVNDDRVRVVQEAAPPPCIFQVRPGNLNIGAAGGTTHAAVSVKDRCAWGASSSVPWVSVASGANGSGSGSSTFRVAPNTGATRSGDITVASQTFTVTQSAAAAGPSGGGGGGGGAGPARGGDDEDDKNDDGGRDDNSGKDKGKGKDKGGKGKGDTL